MTTATSSRGRDARGNTEAWDGFGGDTERGLARPATGSFTFDEDAITLTVDDDLSVVTVMRHDAGESVR